MFFTMSDPDISVSFVICIVQLGYYEHYYSFHEINEYFFSIALAKFTRQNVLN